MKKIMILISLLATPAFSDVTSPSGRTVDCFCTDSSGLRVELGESICLFVDGRAFMARCEMSLNVPMWRQTGDACASSGLLERFQNLDPVADTGGVDAKI